MDGKKKYTKPLIVVEEYEMSDFAKNCDDLGGKILGAFSCYDGPTYGWIFDCDEDKNKVSISTSMVETDGISLSTPGNASLVLNETEGGEISTMDLLCHGLSPYVLIWCRSNSEKHNPGEVTMYS